MKWLGKAIVVLIIAVMARDCFAQDKANLGILSEDKSLIVELMVNRDATGENIEVYQHEGGFVVPLGYMLDFIDFPIKVNVSEGQVYGWFIRENRTFMLDINKRIIVIEGKEIPLDSRLVVSGADDIYVDSSLFAEWFPIDLELDFSRLVLKIKPREELPFQAKEERDRNRNKIRTNEKKQKNYQPVVTEPANFSIPFVNIDIGNQFDSSADNANSASYSILAQGDAAKLSTNLFLSGDSEESLTNMRIMAENKDSKGGLLGVMHATQYSIGDINTLTLPLVSTSGRGRGVYVSNTDLTRPDQFDQTSFVGNSQPGWEVEIYRNGELLGFQLIGDDGRYEFKNIPVLYGNNNFKIISYGPQGQVYEEVKNYSIDDSILQKGIFNYSFSADEKAQSVFGIDEQNTVLQHEKEPRGMGFIEYGITDMLTVSTGVTTTPLEDGATHNYQTVGVKGSTAGVLAAVNVAHDYENKGSAGRAVLNTSIKDISMRVERDQFNGFVSEEESVTSNLRESTSKIDINGRISALILSGISYAFGVQEEKYANDLNVMTYSNRLSTSLYSIGFGNDLKSVVTDADGTESLLTTGIFSIRGSYKDVFIRLSADYYAEPVSELQAVNLSLQKNLKNKLNLRSDIRKDLGSSSLTTVNLGLTKEFGSYRLSTITSADTNDNYTIGVRLSFSVGRDTGNNQWFAKSGDVAGAGAVSASAFVDNNYNGLYDGDDYIMENVEFKAGQRPTHQKDGEKSALITGIEPFIPQDVEISTASIEDPFLTPQVKGYNVMTRPGIITRLLFPVMYTTEIDGTAYIETEGTTHPLSRAIIELIDGEGKVFSTAKSEYDGFYILTGVIPGDYKIRISVETLEGLGIESAPEVKINIPPQSDFVSGIDVVAIGN